MIAQLALTAMAMVAPGATDVVGTYNPPTHVARRVLHGAHGSTVGLVAVNYATDARIWDCVPTDPKQWECGIRLYWADGTRYDVLMTLKPVLNRKRRNGHWVGRWHRTKDWSATSVAPFDELRRRP